MMCDRRFALSSAKKHWKKFCEYAGWDNVKAAVFIRADGTIKDGTFRRFFMWLDEQETTTFSVFDVCLKWCQRCMSGSWGFSSPCY